MALVCGCVLLGTLTFVWAALRTKPNSRSRLPEPAVTEAGHAAQHVEDIGLREAEPSSIGRHALEN